jgi:hypothetical protein
LVLIKKVSFLKETYWESSRKIKNRRRPGGGCRASRGSRHPAVITRLKFDATAVKTKANYSPRIGSAKIPSPAIEFSGD